MTRSLIDAFRVQRKIEKGPHLTVNDRGASPSSKYFFSVCQLNKKSRTTQEKSKPAKDLALVKPARIVPPNPKSPSPFISVGDGHFASLSSMVCVSIDPGCCG